MKNFILANQMIDSLKGDEDLNVIQNTLKEAYHLSYLALDALVLLSRTYSDYFHKINLLKEGLSKVKDYDYKIDSLAYRQYIRTYYELFLTFHHHKRPILAYECLKKLEYLKPDVFDVHNLLYAYEIYFHHEHTFSLEDQALQAFLESIAYYALDDIENSANRLKQFALGYPKFIGYLMDNQESKQYQDIASMMLKYSFLINQNGGYLNFCLEVFND